MSKVKLGIIGGTGLDDRSLLQNSKEKEVTTPFGKPSDVVVVGTSSGVDCVFLARHGRGHKIAPSDVNYRANIWALKEEGCTHVIATTACRSLQGYIHPGEVILPHDFLDRTTQRKQTFYDGTLNDLEGISHVPMNEPFCPQLRAILASSIKSLGQPFHERGTVITVEGPRYSTWAESRLWREWRADVVNMSTVPEYVDMMARLVDITLEYMMEQEVDAWVVLAKEAGLLYASLALVKDYDTWRDDHEAIHVELAAKTFTEVVEKTCKIILHAIPKIAEYEWDGAIAKNKEIARLSIMK